MLKIIITIILMSFVLWNIYSLWLILEDEKDTLVKIAKIYWGLIWLLVLFIFCYGIVNRIF